MDLIDRGRIVTSERQLTRLLAAEIRFAPDLAQEWVKTHTGLPVGPLRKVTCERSDRAHLDIVLEFDHHEIGVEAKIDHELTIEQARREASAVDHVIFVVINPSTVPRGLPKNTSVTTWVDVLANFPQARVDASDLSVFSDKKNQARSALLAAKLATLAPAGWVHDDKPSNGNFPSWCLHGNDLAEGRYITTQVAATRTISSNDFIVNVGLRIADIEPPLSWPQEMPSNGWPRARKSNQEWPLMIQEMAALLEKKLVGAGLTVSQESASPSNRVNAYKLAIAARYGIPPHHVVGYADSYWGLKLTPVPPTRLRKTMRAVIAAVEVTDSILKQHFPPPPEQ